MSEFEWDAIGSQLVCEARRTVEEALPDQPLRDAVLLSFNRLTVGGEGMPLRLPPLAFIPALVHAGITGVHEPAVPFCSAALLLYLGIDQLDDLMDGPVEGGPEQLLVAATLTSAIPQHAIAHMNVPPECARDLQLSLARCLAEMAGGQRFDLVSRGSWSFSTEAVEQAIAERSGALAAMLAEAGAILAGAPSDVALAYAGWGCAYGTADQIRADTTELLRDQPSEDLRNGTLTYPVACLVEATPLPERPGIFALMREADADPGARSGLRELLQARGALATSALVIDWHCGVGLRYLDHASPTEPARSALRSMLERTRIPGTASSTLHTTSTIRKETPA